MKSQQKKITKQTSRSRAKSSLAPSTYQDVKTSILVVSVGINLFILIGWLTLQLSNRFDEQIAGLLF